MARMAESNRKSTFVIYRVFAASYPVYETLNESRMNVTLERDYTMALEYPCCLSSN